jgi:hypothetical protein
VSNCINDGTPSARHDDSGLCTEEGWQRRAEQAEQNARRLADRLRGRDERIAALEKAIARTLAAHNQAEERMEREIESLRDRLAGAHIGDGDLQGGPQIGSVLVRLPYLTETLRALFAVMHTIATTYDEHHPPKSANIAREIDERLGRRLHSNGEASRSAQTYAAAIRPGFVHDSDT